VPDEGRIGRRHTLIGVAHDFAKHFLPAFGCRWRYCELKDRLAAGTPLSREELDFIRAYEQRSSERGWHQLDQIAAFRFSEYDRIVAGPARLPR
jgi:hypothetical protein